jgi:hypothetical protein
MFIPFPNKPATTTARRPALPRTPNPFAAPRRERDAGAIIAFIDKRATPHPHANIVRPLEALKKMPTARDINDEGTAAAS